jgi:hypothetical protein
MSTGELLPDIDELDEISHGGASARGSSRKCAS